MIRFFIAVAAFMVATAATAEPVVGTIGTKGTPLTRGGELFACSINFDNLHLDRVYLPEKMVAVSGSISLFLSENSGRYMLKVVVNDSISGPAGVTFSPNVPFEINMETSQGDSTYGLDRVEEVSDTPGGKVAIFRFEDEKISKIMENLMDTQSTVIVFNRRKGGMDIRVPVDFTVVDTDSDGKRTRDNSSIMSFLDCQIKLISKVIPAKQQ